MRKLFWIFLGFIGLLFSSCELERSVNGDLDGFWHLTAVDTLATGGHGDLSEAKVFWAFQVRLVRLRRTDTDFLDNGVVAHFTYKGNELLFSAPSWHHREQGDPLIKEEEKELLALYGVSKLEQCFKVIQLNSKRMILQTDVLRLTFDKM